MKITIASACALAALASPLAANEPLALKVRPNVALAPATVIVQAMIEPDAQNRAVEIVAESNDFYRSSQFQLEGDRSRRTSQMELRSLPPGAYDVRVTLYGPGGAARAIVRQHVSIIGEGHLPGDSPSDSHPAAARR